MADFRYEVTERICVLSEGRSQTKELRRVSFRDGPARLDVRKWTLTGDDERMGKGISLTDAEAVALRDALNALDLRAG